MVRGVGNIKASAVLQQVVTNFQRIRQGAPCSDLVGIYSGSTLYTGLPCLFVCG